MARNQNTGKLVKNVSISLIANEDAVGFYDKIGMKKADEVMKYNYIESKTVSSVASRILYHCAGCDRDAREK